MPARILTSEMIQPLIVGGAILGGGGGGAISRGRKMAKLAFDMGTPTLVDINDLNDEDLVVTVSSVGAPAAKNRYVQPIDYVETLQLLKDFSGISPKALITNENGGSATVNGLLQSSILGIPVLDAPCNGRAHPTGIMGSMNLNEMKAYQSTQVAIGGYPGSSSRVSQVVEGSLHKSSKLVRQAAVEAGGLVAVARNPVSVSYIKENAALGGFTHALEVGMVHQEGITPQDKVDNVLKKLNGEVLGRGIVRNLKIETINGFDLGSLEVDIDTYSLELTFWNEYMTCDQGDERLATFPDLLMTFSAENGMPINTAELKEGQEIIVINSSYNNLKLGSGMLNPNNYNIVEQTLNKNIIEYIQPLFD